MVNSGKENVNNGQNCLKYSKMLKNGPIWPKIVKNGRQLSQIVKNGSNWSKIVKNGKKSSRNGRKVGARNAPRLLV